MKLSDTQYLVVAVVPGGTVYKLQTSQFSTEEDAIQELQYHLSKDRPAQIFVPMPHKPLDGIYAKDNDGNYRAPLTRKPLDAPWS